MGMRKGYMYGSVVCIKVMILVTLVYVTVYAVLHATLCHVHVMYIYIYDNLTRYFENYNLAICFLSIDVVLKS